MRTSRAEYASLLNQFVGKDADIGTSRDAPPAGSVGEWLQGHVTKTAIASYVGTILIAEGYAERVPGDSSKIRVVKTLKR